MSGHIAIVGAGIVGVAAAHWLLRAGWRVTLIDRDEPGQATSFGNAGVLACAAIVPVTTPGLLSQIPKYLTRADSPLFVRWPYLPRMLPWLTRYLSQANDRNTRSISGALHPLLADALGEHQALAANTPAAAFIHPSQYVFAYPNEAAYQTDQYTWALRRAAGYHPTLYKGPDVQAFDASYSHSLGLLAVLDDHGRINLPGQYTQALAQAASADGATFIKAQVDQLIAQGTRIRTVHTTCGQSIDADAILVASGVWSKGLLVEHGIRVPLESERGYHVMYTKPQKMPRCPTMIAAGKFVATPMSDGLRCAGVVEFGGLEAGASDAPLALLKRMAPQAFTGFSASVASEWLGHRPATPDSLPLLGAVPNREGLFLAFGHQHIGLTAAAKTGRVMAQLISGQTPSIDLHAYRCERFS